MFEHDFFWKKSFWPQSCRNLGHWNGIISLCNLISCVLRTTALVLSYLSLTSSSKLHLSRWSSSRCQYLLLRHTKNRKTTKYFWQHVPKIILSLMDKVQTLIFRFFLVTVHQQTLLLQDSSIWSAFLVRTHWKMSYH